MIRFFLGAWMLFCVVSSPAQTPADSVALATAAWQISDLGDGAESRYAQLDLFDSRQSISVVSYPPRRFETRILALERRAEITSRLGREAGADIAVNGSYFIVKTFESVTFVWRNGRIEGRTTPGELMRTNGVVAFKDRRGRRMEIFRCDTAGYDRVMRRYRSALAAGPVLVADGRIVVYDSKDPFYTGRNPRTLIGKRADGTVLMVVIDGRFKGQADGVTIAEEAFIARQLGLVEALNLDGGGSSTLWTARDGVLNHPYDNHRFDHAGERGVPNCIVATRKR